MGLKGIDWQCKWSRWCKPG